MLGFLKASLYSVLFGVILLAGLASAPKPASAACVCVGAVTQLIGPTPKYGPSVCDCLANTIFGKTSTFPRKFEEGNLQFSGQLKSLVDYFENVFWPRWIGMEQKIMQGTLQTNAANTHTDIQLLDVQAQHAFMMKRDEKKADHVVQTMGRTDVACPEATLSSPLSGARIISDLDAYRITSEFTERQDSSSKFPDLANGIVNFYNKMIDERNRLGLCNPEGNNGMDAEWCTSSKPKIRNADVNPALARLTRTYGSNQEEPTYIEYAKRMRNNLFDFIFTPLRKEQLTGGKANQINEVLFDRIKFTAQLANLQLPFAEDVANRTPVPGIDDAIKKAYAESLKLMGAEPNGDVAKLYQDQNGQMSLMAMEEIYFRNRNLDPSEITRVTGNSALNLENIELYTAFKVMNSLVLLYDIRQELRQSNKLLGTIGSLLAADRHQSIEAKIQSVSSN